MHHRLRCRGRRHRARSITAALTIGSYWKSDAVALAVSRARPADPQEYKRLYNLVEGLCIAAGLPMPRIYIVDDVAPNAFATGRNPKHAAIAVTTGLLEKMNRVELEGVLAHELSHIKNYDILVSTLAVTLVGAIAVISDIAIRMMWFGGGRRSGNDRDGNAAGAIFLVIGLVLLAFAPLIARVMQFAVSRRRESLADVSGVALTRYPPGLISALEKLRDDQTVVGSALPSHRPPLDRAADRSHAGGGSPLPHQPLVRHASPVRGAHRCAQGALIACARSPGALFIVLAAAGGLALSACSSGAGAASGPTTADPSTTASTSTTLPATTTTAAPPAGRAAHRPAAPIQRPRRGPRSS